MDVFHVLTEFKFEAGEAILNSERVQNAVEGISTAADQAAISFQNLSFSILNSFGIGAFSVIGILEKAIKVTDKFNTSALSFANIISANHEHFRGLNGDVGSFAFQLEASKATLMSISKVAREFSLDESAMGDMVKGMAAVLSPVNLAGSNFSTAIDLSRSALKAAPTLGMQPSDVQQQMVRMITGQAYMSETLFRRLISDTTALKPYQQQGSGAFNALPIAKRVKLLQDAFAQFSSNLDVVRGNAHSLNGEMTAFKNLLGGFDSILRPIGEAVLPPLLKLFHALNDVLHKNMRPIIQNLSKAMGDMTKDPEKFFVVLMQLRNLKKDTSSAAHLMGTIVIFKTIGEVMKFLGFRGGLLATILGKIGNQFGVLAGMFSKMVMEYTAALLFLMGPFQLIITIAMNVYKAFNFVFEVFADLLVWLMLFQIISRARGQAKANDVKELPDTLTRLSASVAKVLHGFGNIFHPIDMMMDLFSKWLAPLFQIATYANYAANALDKLGRLLEWMGDAMILAEATMSGFFYAIFDGIYHMMHPIETGGGIMNFDFLKSFNEGIDEYLNKSSDRFSGEKTKTTSVVQNIGTVRIENNFKENLEPDRIAFTIADQLKKNAQNATQGRGTTFPGSINTGRLGQ